MEPTRNDADAAARTRPRLVVSVTTTIDGRVTVDRSSTLLEPDAQQVWRSLHTPGADRLIAERRRWLEERHQPRAVLEGSGTFVTESAGPPAALPAPATDGSELFRHHLPDAGEVRWFVVVDGRGRVRWTSRGDESTRLLVLVSAATPAAYLAYLRREAIPYLVAGASRVDLGLALTLLQTRLGLQTVVSEAGGGLNGALLRAGLVDELHVVLLPALLGGRDVPASFDGPPLGPGDVPLALQLHQVRSTHDGALWLHYAVDGGPG